MLDEQKERERERLILFSRLVSQAEAILQKISFLLSFYRQKDGAESAE